MRRALFLALVALAAAGAWIGRPRPAAHEDGLGARRAAPPARDGAAPAPADPLAPPLAAGDTLPRPRSLRGTRVDGGFVVDADGRFVPTIDARRLFDYFLTATGEVAADALRSRIVREIERRLPPQPAAEAVALLDRYLAYRARVRALATADAPDDDLDSRLASLMAIRREALGPEAADAFFAEEEADARRLLETRRIANDPTLAPEERAARVEAIFAAGEADLPPEVREARATARLATTLRAAEDQIRARGGEAAEIAAVRERLAGPEAAGRLAALDRERAAWRERVAAFRTARGRIRHDARLGEDARAAAETRLLEESFTPTERRRVEALDRLAADASAVVP
ncbi:MAG: lipase chaperone [Deltaproteobacteria bacterium]|nr:lipase chaperone [Deltaproteobacteria bacterium]